MEEEKTIKKSKKKTMIITLSGVLGFLVIGTGLGIFLGSYFSPKGMDYSNYSENEYEDDVEAIYAEYLSDTTEDYLSYSPSDLANIAIFKFTSNPYTSTYLKSDAKALGVTQKTYTHTIKNDETYFSESLSYSTFVKIAKRFYEEDETIDIHVGSLKNSNEGLSGEYSSTPDESLTLEEYEEAWGLTLHDPLSYIISSKTTLDTSSVTKEGDNYLITLDLDPTTSVLKYVKQIMKMSELSDSPEFENVHLELTLDLELNLKSTYIKEDYYVWIVGKNYTDVTSIATHEVFDVEQYVPSVNETITYE